MPHGANGRLLRTPRDELLLGENIFTKRTEMTSNPKETALAGWLVMKREAGEGGGMT